MSDKPETIASEAMRIWNSLRSDERKAKYLKSRYIRALSLSYLLALNPIELAQVLEAIQALQQYELLDISFGDVPSGPRQTRTYYMKFGPDGIRLVQDEDSA